MSELAPVLLIVVVVGIFAAVIWLLVRTSRHNRGMRDETVGADLAGLAGDRGWGYTPVDRGYLDRFGGEYPFRGARQEPAYDLVTGVHRGRSFACFQYEVPRAAQAEPGPMQRNYIRVFTVSLGAPVPTMLVTGARWHPKWQRKFTTGDDAFDDAFNVAPDDERFAHAVLTEPVKQWLRDNPPLAGAGTGSLRFIGSELVGWQPEKDRFDAGVVEPTLDYLCGLLDRIPPDTLR